jgi:hypothetical protein
LFIACPGDGAGGVRGERRGMAGTLRTPLILWNGIGVSDLSV